MWWMRRVEAAEGSIDFLVSAGARWSVSFRFDVVVDAADAGDGRGAEEGAAATSTTLTVVGVDAVLLEGLRGLRGCCSLFFPPNDTSFGRDDSSPVLFERPNSIGTCSCVRGDEAAVTVTSGIGDETTAEATLVFRSDKLILRPLRAAKVLTGRMYW